MAGASLVGRSNLSRLFLVRHGLTEFNSARMFMGHTDAELSSEGHKQVERLSDRLATEKIDAVYSSDLRRALATAKTIASKHGLKVTICPELREINYGKIEGITFEDIKRLYPEVAELFSKSSLQLKFPEGESVDELRDRLSRFLDNIKRHTAEETILIAAHNGPLRLMVCSLLGMELRHWRQIRIDPASLTIVNTYPEIVILSLLNDTSHLR